MSKRRRGGAIAGSAVINILMLMLSIFSIFPFIWMIYSSFKTEAQFQANVLALPTELHFENYVTAFETGRMDIYALNSLFNCVITVLLVTFASFIVAYFLSRYKFRGHGLVYGLFITGMLIPVHSLMVPLFMEYKTINFLDNRFTLLPVYFAFAMPMAVFLLESFIGTIPVELEEAAMIDGSNMLRTMFTIIMPLCRPIMATVLILTFMNTWNEFPFALVLIKNEALKTIPLGLKNFQGAYTAQYTLFMAGMTISLIPVMAVYAAFSNKIIQGMTAGTVKG